MQMADLGSVGTAISSPDVLPLDSAYAWNIANNPIRCTDGAGATPRREDWKTLSGIIRDSTLLSVARRYSILRRTDSVEFGNGTSAVDGTFSNRVPFADPVFLIAFDSGSDNAIVVDNVVPI